MTTMLDRAARALQARAGYTEYGPIVPESLTNDLVRAVLMAVREPDIGVWIDADCDEDAHPISGFTAMIDAILNERQEQ